jgi:predicted NUDIX family NTP pyrophosphohydrolase
MQEQEKTNLIIYRVKDKGLEVFLVRPGKEGADWQIPHGEKAAVASLPVKGEETLIELDPVSQEDGILEQAYALEGDWHDIPSIKSILVHDVEFMKDTLRKMVPDVMEKGAFFAIKEAFKKVLPHQYEQLKELKEIIVDRNLTKYM